MTDNGYATKDALVDSDWALAHLNDPNVRIAESDEATTAEVTRPLAERAPRGELRSYPGTHFDFYLATPVRERALADQVDFLRRHLT